MDLEDLTPAGGSLRVPVIGHRGQVVAQFTVSATPRPDELWEHGKRATDATRDGTQGSPMGSYRQGHSLEHEPVDKAERGSQHVVQDVAEHAARIRAALRPGI
jgi:hypothetical protein